MSDKISADLISRNAIEYSPGFVIVKDSDLRYRLTNRGLLEKMGWTEEDVINKTDYDLFSRERADRHVRTDREVLLTGNTLMFDSWQPFDDDDCQYEVVKTPIPLEEGHQGVLCIIHDISGRVEAERALRESEGKYRLLVENQTELVVKIDTEGRFLFVSPTYCKLFGKTQEELLGRPFMPLVHGEDLPLTEESMRQVTRPPYHGLVEVRTMTKDGWRWVAWSSRAILGDDGEVRSIVSVGRDVTSRVEAERALRKTAAELDKERQILAEKNVALKQILDHIEQERRSYRQSLWEEARDHVLPLVDQLSARLQPSEMRYLEQIKLSLETILNRDSKYQDDVLLKLTPREWQICDMIRSGASSKEISDELNISLYTVKKHRESIRRKLAITNKSINLSRYLQTVPKRS